MNCLSSLLLVWLVLTSVVLGQEKVLASDYLLKLDSAKLDSVLKNARDWQVDFGDALFVDTVIYVLETYHEELLTYMSHTNNTEEELYISIFLVSLEHIRSSIHNCSRYFITFKQVFFHQPEVAIDCFKMYNWNYRDAERTRNRMQGMIPRFEEASSVSVARDILKEVNTALMRLGKYAIDEDQK